MKNEGLTLQPMSMGGIFDKAIRFYKNEFSAFAAVFMAAYVPFAVARLVVETAFLAPALMNILNSPTGSIFYLVQILLPAGAQRFLATMIAVIPTAHLVRNIINNEEVSVRAAYRQLGKRLGLWLWSYGLLIIVLGVMALWAAIPVVGWAGGVGLLWMFLLIAPKLLGVLIAFEDQSALENMKRIWLLIRIRFWWLLAFVIGLFCFDRWLSSVPGTVLQSVFAFFIEDSAVSVEMRIALFRGLQILVRMFSDMFSMPISIIIVTLVYVDLRAQAEGLDLQMRASMDMQRLPGDTRGALLTRRDFMNLLWLSLIVLLPVLWIYQNPDDFYLMAAIFSFWFP